MNIKRSEAARIIEEIREIVMKTYSELISDLEEASIALRYCTDPSERPALLKAKLAAESAVEAFNDAEADQDLTNGV